METQSVNVLSNPGFAAFNAEKKIAFIRPFDPKQAMAIDGYRHAIVRYRDTTKGVSVKPAKMVTIPCIRLPEDSYQLPDVAAKVLVGTIEDQQDIIIRELIDNGASLIEFDQVSLDASFAALTAVRVSTRMTKEQIDAWVKVALVGVLTTRANEISDNQRHDSGKRAAQVALTINAYADNFSRLSAPVPNLGQEKATMLKNVLTLANVSDDIGRALIAKLNAILNPEVSIDNL